MAYRYLSLAALVLCLLTTSCATSKLKTEDYSTLSKDQLITRVFEAKKMEEVYNATVLAGFNASFNSGPAASLLSDDQKESITTAVLEIIEQEIPWTRMVNEVYMPMYDSLYTSEELAAILPILESGSFAIMMDRDLAMLPESMQRASEMSMEMVPRLTEKMMEIMGSGQDPNPMPNPKQN